LLIDETAESISTLARLGVVNSDGSIAKAACDISISGVVSAGEDFGFCITQSHFMSVSSLNTFLVKDFLLPLRRCATDLLYLVKSLWDF